jgi:hypothetical protein
MAITHPATVSSATALMFVLALASACETSPPSRALADHSDTDRQGSMQVRAGAARTVIEAPEIPHAISTATTPLVILDVRPEGPYAAGHLPGAVRLDHRTWESDSLSEESGLDN